MAYKVILKALYSSLFGSRPTNWNQIFTNINPEVWIRYEQQFRHYPEAVRGFKKSLFEKYVFAEPGVEVPDQSSGSSGGDLVMVQVGAPPDMPKRYVMWRDRSNSYECQAFSPSLIQQWFAKAGKQGPRPRTDLAPATPPDWHVEAESWDSTKMAYALLFACCALLGVFLRCCIQVFQAAAERGPQ